jgi:metal-responsive CopG/Arc/MetJ family transcriptional regulator
MGLAVKKTISLPQDLAKDAEEMAREEGKSLSAIIQEALKIAKRERQKRLFREMQSFWSKKATEKGILTEDDLAELLK